MLLISIIVPVFNSEIYLGKCISSILNQTFKDIEIILVNDGSIDNSVQICDDFAKADDRVKVIHKINGGVSTARNLGIDNAKGKYITFVYSDDYIDITMYKNLLEYFDKFNADLVMCGFVYEKE